MILGLVTHHWPANRFNVIKTFLSKQRCDMVRTLFSDFLIFCAICKCTRQQLRLFLSQDIHSKNQKVFCHTLKSQPEATHGAFPAVPEPLCQLTLFLVRLSIPRTRFGNESNFFLSFFQLLVKILDLDPLFFNL